MVTVARSPLRYFSSIGIKLSVVTISLALLAGIVSAQSQICVKRVNTTPTPFNGVVAPGVDTAGTCPAAPLWSLVAPAGFLPNVGLPEAFLYLAYNPTINHLYLGFDLKGDDDLSDQDVIAVVVDADNSGTFNAGDFSFKVKVSSLSPIRTDNPGGNPANNCSSAEGTPPTGPVEVLRHDGTVWAPIMTTAIATRFAYDYENVAGDTENGIWNLAVDLKLGTGTDFNIAPEGVFRIGAYIFMDSGHHSGGGVPQTGSVLRWPVEMVTRKITEQNLFGIPATAATELAIATLNDTCFDVNFTAANPWEINGFVANAYDSRIIRNGLNTFKVTFLFDGPGTTPQPLTNNGTVRLSLTPYRASGSGTAWFQDKAFDAANFNSARSVEFQFDFANPPPSFGGTGDINFVCATMSLVNFQRDDNNSNNSHNVNHNQFMTSDYAAEFFVFGSGMPGLKPGERTTVFLRFDSNNDPVAANSGSGGMISPSFNWPWSNRLTSIALLIVFLMSLLSLWYLATRRPAFALRRYVAGMGILWLILLSWQWSCKSRSQTLVETSRWQVQNVDELELKPVKGERNLYEMSIKHGEAKRVKLRFEGRDLPYRTERHTFDPRGPEGAHNTLSIPVKEGEVVSVVAFGEIDLDGQAGPLAPTSPTGRIVLQSSPTPGVRNVAAPDRLPWLLTRGYYTPEEYAGALIGSFDNFETSFVVGRSSSIIAPPNSSALSLAVNAPRGGFASITGSYELFTIVARGPATPTHTMIQGDATFRLPHRIEPWDHLTGLNVYTYYPTISRREDGTILSQTLNPWGAANFTIFDSHVR